MIQIIAVVLLTAHVFLSWRYFNWSKTLFFRDIKNQVPSGFGYGAAMAYCAPPGGFAPRMMMRSMPMPMAQHNSGFGGGVQFAACSAAPPQPLGGMRSFGFARKCKRSSPVVEMACLSADSISDDAADFDMSDSCEAEEMKPETKEKKAEDKLTTLVDLQSSDGHFRWGEAVAAHSGKTKDELMATRPDFVSAEDPWITAIVISMLQAMKEEEELWELVVAKAKKFLSKMFSNDQVEKMLSEAAKLI